MSAVLEAPAAPAPAAAAPIPEVSSSSPGGAQGVQHLPQSAAIPPPVTTKTPRSAEPDSALNRARARLEAKVQGKPIPQDPPKTVEKPPEAPSPEDAAKAKEGATESDEDDELLGEKKVLGNPNEEKAKEGEVATEKAAEGDKTKVNPWKVVEEHKTARAQLEKEVVELKRLVPNAEARKAEIAEVEQVRKRNEELESHIKFVDYQMSKEYKETYEKPYEQQWINSMKELKGVTVASADGLDEREITANDMLELVNMSMTQARKVAKEAFGDSAEDVMTQRAEIRKLSDAKFEAINKAKKEGAEWSDKAVKQQESKMAELNQEVSTSYKQAVKAFESNPKYAEFFQPIEGDEVANTTLTDGYAMVDRAFAANPMDPKLTPEQRKSVVKLHAAIKHRAAAFGRVKYLLQKEREGRAADRKKLSQYESTVPNRDGSKPAAASSSFTGTGSKMAAAEARLRARAK